MQKKFLIAVYGPMCAGKSTISKMLASEFPGVFHISYDKIKWFITDYSAEKYSGKGIVSRLLSTLVTQVATEGFSIIIEGDLNLMRNHQIYEKIAKENGMNFIQINIEAPFEVVGERFEERLRISKEQNIKVSITTEEGMRTRFEVYQKEKHTELPTYDSSKMTPDEIVSNVKGLLSNL